MITACASTNKLPIGQQSFQRIEKTITSKLEGQYLLYLPEEYGGQEKWPLLLFLHGAGERGADINLVKVHGPPKLIEEGKDFPAIVVSPQCPKGQFWSVEFLDDLLDEIVQRYKTDEDRIYVTGLSMGAYGTWSLALEYPHRFAAIAPICGGSNPVLAHLIQHLPIWVFHGAKDKVVTLENSQEMVDALKKLKADVKFTIYPDAGHDSWTETYNNPDFYNWLFCQKR